MIGRCLILAVLTLLAACGSPAAPRPGTAQEAAASSNARAVAAASAADQAERDATAAAAASVAADRAATEEPTADRIQSAAAARITRDQTAAIAHAFRDQEARLAIAAAHAQRLAEDERTREQTEQDYRAWRRLCLLVGLAGVALGGLVGGLVGWLAGPSPGAIAGGILAGTGCLVIALGPATAWLPWAVPAAGVIALVIWTQAHRRARAAIAAARTVALGLSRTVDALEGRATVTATTAKQLLHEAVEGSGLRDMLTAARATWKADP